MNVQPCPFLDLLDIRSGDRQLPKPPTLEPQSLLVYARCWAIKMKELTGYLEGMDGSKQF